MKNRRINKLLLTVFLSTLVPIFFCCFALKAEAAEEKTLDLLLKEDADIEQVRKDILEKNENIQIQVYEDINLVHLIYPETFRVEEIVQDEGIQEKIELKGELPKLEETKLLLEENMISNITLESENLSRKSNVGINLFNMLAWHVNEVTENGQSLKLARGKGVSIALIDSGVDTTHPVLAGKINVKNGKSYVTGDDTITDRNSHGTATAGIIAQIAPDAIITPYKVMGAKDGESLWTIAAILDAVNDGNDVINLSLGTYKRLDDSDERILINAFKRAIKYAENNNVEVFASSGNKSINLDQNYETNKEMHLPGEIKGVNTISAIWNHSGVSYSNYGSCVDFCAPGGELVFQNGLLDLTACIFIACPTYIDNGLVEAGIPQGYTFSYGTSLSSAVATACFADVYSYGKENYRYFQKDDAIKILTASSEDLGDVGKDIYYGNGEINIYNAISEMGSIYEGEVIENDKKSRTYSTNSITAEYKVIEEYEDKYHVNVTLTNKTSETIHKWEIAMDCDSEIEQIWDGEVSKDGDYIIISNAGYNQDIEAEGAVSFGFIATKTSSEEEIRLPDEIILVNENYMIDSKDYVVSCETSSQWEGGSIVNITITNNSNQTISDWKIEFTYDATIEEIWCATIEDKDDNYYSILNDGSNQNIPVGGSVSFGFKAAGFGEEVIDNISLISTIN